MLINIVILSIIVILTDLVLVLRGEKQVGTVLFGATMGN
jgi:hypothetical protein